jgi:hypothetical protein
MVVLFCCPKGVIYIEIYHCSIKVISRGNGKSDVSAVVYRSGKKLTNRYNGIVHDYTRKSRTAQTEVMLAHTHCLNFQTVISRGTW